MKELIILLLFFENILTAVSEKSIEEIRIPNTNEHKIFRVPETRFRLSNSFIPHHYEIRILLDPGELTAPGSVIIYGTCANEALNITLHSQVAINETSVKVTNLDQNLEEIPVVGHSYDAEKTFYTVELNKTLSVGLQYSISIEYVAEVYLENLEGLYRNHYDDPITGQTKYSIATQLQAFGARKVFPSFDEPAMKATFDITLGRRSNYSTISNSPLLNTLPIPGMDGWVWDIYNTTVKMPTYLIAIIVGDFTFAEASPEIYHKPVRTFGPKYLIDQGYGEVPSEIAAKVLYFFDNFFDVPYAMHKMDSIGIVDFPAGAMENYGLNIYKDAYLLYSAAIQRNERDRRGVALTLNHELAHQWFGNYITLDWWTMAWINEGFATYLSYIGLENTNPEYEAQKAIQFDCVQNAMRNDVLDNSHPTVLPEKWNPWDTMTYNANLVYSKGAALLRMMEGFLTLDTLQKALQNFLKAYAYQPVDQDQLFSVLNGQAVVDGRLPVGATIKSIMDTWTLQKGFPLVKVSLNQNFITLTQEEYKADNETRIYYIPITIATQSQPNLNNTLPHYWLYTQPNGLQISHPTNQFFIVNSGATGYYRVEYDETLTQRIQAQLLTDHELITLGSRSQLLDDYFTFSFDKRIDVEVALEFTTYLSREIEFSVWSAFFYHMNKPRRMLLGRLDGISFKEYLLRQVSGALDGLKNSGADLDIGAVNLFYAQLVDWSVVLQNDEIMALALQYYDEWMDNPPNNPIPPILRQYIHCAAVQGTNDTNFMFALNQFANETAASQSQIVQGLPCRSSDLDALNTLWGVVLGTTLEIPKEYSQLILTSSAAVYENFENLLSFINANFERIVEYQGSSRLIANAISSLCNAHSTLESLDAVGNFISQNREKFSQDDIVILNNAVAVLESNIEWMEDFGYPILSWSDANISQL